MIIREFRCNDCGSEFESSDADPYCPHCAGESPERVFLTAPAIRSPVTNFRDHTVRDLAEAHGLSDINNRYGEPVKKVKTDNPSTFAPTEQATQVLSRLPAGAQDSFSPLMGKLKHPNTLPRYKASR